MCLESMIIYVFKVFGVEIDRDNIQCNKVTNNCTIFYTRNNVRIFVAFIIMLWPLGTPGSSVDCRSRKLQGISNCCKEFNLLECVSSAFLKEIKRCVGIFLNF